MDESNRLLNRLIVVGVGLIGGSLALAAKKNDICNKVIGVDSGKKALSAALKRGVIDDSYEDIKEIAHSLESGDLILLSVPTLATSEVLKSLKGNLNEAVTITDTASVKGSVVKDVKSLFGNVPSNFVFGHPIAGAERSGVEAAKSDLYRGHRVILTPVEDTGLEHLVRVSQLWQMVGAEVTQMSFEEHDKLLAATSHLPHVIAYSLVDTLANDTGNDNIFCYAAGGFRDFTRIASSDPQMWHDIVFANRESILASIDLFSDNLAVLKKLIIEEESEAIMATFRRAKKARDEFVALLDARLTIYEKNNTLITGDPSTDG